MNKTPIQELIDEIHKSNVSSQKLMTSDAVMLGRIFESMLHETLQKEKQFAFDCFEAGGEYQEAKFGYDYVERGMTYDAPDFEQFYSQYAQQHKK